MPPPQFVKNRWRYDPYRNFRFRVKFDNKCVAGSSRVSALTRSTEVARHRSVGDPGVGRVMPGQTVYSPMTLEQGVTYDVSFEQ